MQILKHVHISPIGAATALPSFIWLTPRHSRQWAAHKQSNTEIRRQVSSLKRIEVRVFV